MIMMFAIDSGGPERREAGSIPAHGNPSAATIRLDGHWNLKNWLGGISSLESVSLTQLRSSRPHNQSPANECRRSGLDIRLCDCFGVDVPKIPLSYIQGIHIETQYITIVLEPKYMLQDIEGRQDRGCSLACVLNSCKFSGGFNFSLSGIISGKTRRKSRQAWFALFKMYVQSCSAGQQDTAQEPWDTKAQLPHTLSRAHADTKLPSFKASSSSIHSWFVTGWVRGTGRVKKSTFKRGCEVTAKSAIADAVAGSVSDLCKKGPSQFDHAKNQTWIKSLARTTGFKFGKRLDVNSLSSRPDIHLAWGLKGTVPQQLWATLIQIDSTDIFQPKSIW
jgi:hypothetical protein